MTERETSPIMNGGKGPEQPGREVESDRLAGLSVACPQCGTAMQSTGKMHYSPVIKDWLIEYWCPRDRQLFNIYTPETYSLAWEIAADLKENK